MARAKSPKQSNDTQENDYRPYRGRTLIARGVIPGIKKN